MTRRTKDEAGAYVIMFAMLVTSLAVIAAFAVDIGNAVARKSDVQGQADFAALAGARELGTSTSGPIPAAALLAATSYLNKNIPLEHRKACAPDCITTAQLTDGNYNNGEVLWAQDYTGTKFCGPVGLCVITPKEHVDYGLAKVIGINGQDVQASATVGLFSPGAGVMPMYAVTGCDYGLETISDPAGGQANNTPNLMFPSATNTANLSAIVTPNPAQITQTAAGVPGPALSLSGTNFFEPGSGNGNNANPKRVTKIGFFFGDGTTFHTVDVDWNDTTNTASLVRIGAIPAAVASDDGVWWVRVFKQTDTTTDGTWSSVDTAIPMTVGTTTLECAAGASEGNYGTLKIPRWDVTSASDDIPVNIATALDEQVSLATHPATSADGKCSSAETGAVISGDPNPGPHHGTNCVDTDTGLAANVATAGFVTGLNTSKGFIKGRLNAADNPTNPDCNNGGNYTLQLGNGAGNAYSLNNDTLSCFLTDSGSLASILSPGYSGDARLSDEIYESPRFFWVPVLAHEVVSGGSSFYWIVDFRPAFLTDETEDSTHNLSNATDTNGLYVDQNKNLVTQVKVIFFNSKALPSTTNGAVGPYLGVGPKIMRLID